MTVPQPKGQTVRDAYGITVESRRLSPAFDRQIAGSRVVERVWVLLTEAGVADLFG